MNVLVTGSSGYIGGSFIRQYQAQYQFQTFSLLQNSLDTLVLHDIDAVLHCAALVHNKNEHNYDRYYEINVAYPVTLAKKAKREGVKHFIFISTIAVYGEEITYINEYTAVNPVSPYGQSKHKAEEALKALECTQFKVSIIRIPMVYGDDAPGNIALLNTIIQKVPILPFAGIDNRRSFLSIENLINFIDKVIVHRLAGVFLVSDDQAISTTQFIKQLAQKLNKKVLLVRVPFFTRLLKYLKPGIYDKLYNDLVIEGENNLQLCTLLLPCNNKDHAILTAIRKIS